MISTGISNKREVFVEEQELNKIVIKTVIIEQTDLKKVGILCFLLFILAKFYFEMLSDLKIVYICSIIEIVIGSEFGSLFIKLPVNLIFAKSFFANENVFLVFT